MHVVPERRPLHGFEPGAMSEHVGLLFRARRPCSQRGARCFDSLFASLVFGKSGQGSQRFEGDLRTGVCFAARPSEPRYRMGHARPGQALRGIATIAVIVRSAWVTAG